MPIELASGFKVRLLNGKRPLLDGMLVRPFINNPIITANSVSGDFVAPGYLFAVAKTPAPWTVPTLLVDGRARTLSKVMSWDKTLFFPATTLRGYWCEDNNGFFAFGSYLPDGPVTVGPLIPGNFVLQIRLYEDTMR